MTGRCNDSSQTPTIGSYLFAYGNVYGANYTIYNYRNKLQFYAASYYTAPGAPVFHAVGFQSDTAGVNLNTGCNKLHIKGPMILIPMMTLPKKIYSYGYSGILYQFVPWQPGLAGRKLTVQAAWADSQTKRLNLTQANELTLPASAPKPLPERLMVLAYRNSSTIANFTPRPQYFYNPAFAYSHR